MPRPPASRADRLRLVVERARSLLGDEADRALADSVVVGDIREIARTRSVAEIERAFAEAGAKGVRRLAWVARRLLAPPPRPETSKRRRRASTVG